MSEHATQGVTAREQDRQMTVQDAGPWQGPDLETWVARIVAPILREGETLPLVKPFPAAPAEEEETAGAAPPHGAGSSTWAARPITSENDGWSEAEAELREVYGR